MDSDKCKHYKTHITGIFHLVGRPCVMRIHELFTEGGLSIWTNQQHALMLKARRGGAETNLFQAIKFQLGLTFTTFRWISETFHITRAISGCVCKTSRSGYYLCHVCPSAWGEKNRLPLDGCSWHLIFQYFLKKSVDKNSSYIQIWHLYTKIYVHLR